MRTMKPKSSGKSGDQDAGSSIWSSVKTGRLVVDRARAKGHDVTLLVLSAIPASLERREYGSSLERGDKA
jgi:hypothetical protein